MHALQIYKILLCVHNKFVKNSQKKYFAIYFFETIKAWETMDFDLRNNTGINTLF